MWRLQIHPVCTHLANIVCADSGDGLESQLLAAHTHEDLLHLLQEILYICKDRRTVNEEGVKRKEIHTEENI